MKYCKSLSSFCILVSLMAGFASCSDDDPVKIAEPGQMIANVDGLPWTSSAVGALIYNGEISISGESADGSEIVMLMSGTTTGTYAVSGAMGSVPDQILSVTPPNADVTSNPTYSSTYINEAAIGEIIITEIDETNKTISGTFRCQVKRFLPIERTIEVTLGSFNKIPYEDDPGAASTNEFSAKVDGAAFPIFSIGGVSSLGTLVLNFAGTANKTISIGVLDDAPLGSHDFGSFGGSDYYALYTEGSTVYESVSGSVNITSHDMANNRIIGTFSFGGELFPLGGGAISVTEGSFDVTY